MSAPTDNERSRASKLRRAVREGKPLGDADRIWFADYEKRTKKGATAAPPAAASSTPPAARNTPAIATIEPLDSSVMATTPEGTRAHVDARVVHETPREIRFDNIEGMSWIPEVPPAAENAEPAEPATPGAPPPPTAGAPLVDEEKPAGDPEAAKKVGGFVAFIAMLGIKATREMVESMALPEELRVLYNAMVPAASAEAVATFQAAGERLALKYGVGGVSMPDEALVALALVGSGFAVYKNERRKQLGAGRGQRAPQRPNVAPQPSTTVDDEPQQQPHVPTVDERRPPTGPDPLAALLAANPRGDE